MVDTKNLSLLREISAKFTEETLKECFVKIYGRKQIEILSWQIGSAGGKGDYYLSTINKANVKALVDGKEAEVNVIIKSLPNNIARRKTFRSAEFFQNEINFYLKVVPKFMKFLLEKKHSEFLTIPCCYTALTDGNNDYLVLEDVSFSGFGPLTRQNTITYDQCLIILRSMAKFHSISIAYHDQHKESYEDLVYSLIETYFKEERWEWYKRQHTNLVNVAKDALSKEYPDSAAEKAFNAFKLGELFEINVGFTNYKVGPTCAISQGDCWAANFLVRAADSGEKQALILDFQLARSASPILDISFFLYSCTSQEFRDAHFDEMLKFYHTELCNAIKLLGSNPNEIYPWNLFTQEVKKYFLHGLTFALEAIPFSLLDESEAIDLDSLTEPKDLSEVMIATNINSKVGRQRLASMIVDAEKRGFLEKQH
ncbi:uncharacterized protein [Prorops nasuta]|uniref:uncharacterized protein n=1 Tax=Prorops nasuta TaxID=863751 RepID=UPI0034CEAF3D